MQDPWLAVDGSTSLRVRARQMHRAWERVHDRAEALQSLREVRAPIADSWQRALRAGFDTAGWAAPVAFERSQASERFAEHPLGRVVELLAPQLEAIQEQTENLLVLSDAHGVLLRIVGDPGLRERAAEDMNFVEGARWSEEVAGTNAVGLAITADHRVQVFASEHFNENVQAWSCSAAPVHDPVSGAIVGIVDLTGPYESVHRLLLPLAATIATTMERGLAELRRDEDDRLRRRYADLARTTSDVLVARDGRPLAGGGPPLPIPPGGGSIVLPHGAAAVAEPLGAGEAFLVRPLAGGVRSGPRSPLRFSALGRDRVELELDGARQLLSRRHSEILVLLAERPDGLSAEQLAIALFGDAGKPVTVRAELSRLRPILGERLQTDPYRLEPPVESDLAALRRLLRQGRIAAAAELHGDVLLPRSEAPAVVELRDELQGWTRNAVMTSDDPEALWSWISHRLGADDLPAWVRFLSSVRYEDARRPLAAAHVAALRRQLDAGVVGA